MLLEFAGRYFEHAVDKDGKGSAIDHLVQVAASTGMDADQLIEETLGVMEPPSGTEWVWEFFLMLNSARQHSGEGPLPIPFAEIASWSRLTRVSLEIWEVQALRNLDLVWLTWRAKDGRRS